MYRNLPMSYVMVGSLQDLAEFNNYFLIKGSITILVEKDDIFYHWFFVIYLNQCMISLNLS